MSTKSRVTVTPGSIEELLRKKMMLKTATVEAGFSPKATYPKGKYVAQVMHLNHWGGKNDYDVPIPSRPFMNLAISRGAKQWEKIVKLTFERTGDGTRALLTAGHIMAGDIRKAIIDLKYPPNAPSTIARKKSSNPLVDTGHARDSVTYRILGRA